MNNWMHVDWRALFELSVPFAEIIVRGTAIYWFLFFIFRFLIRRDVGNVGLADILLLVIVADASQNAMAGESHSVSDGMLLVATLIGWNMLLDWLSYRFPLVRKVFVPPSLCLIKNGLLMKRNMRRELISNDELWAKLREQGIEDLQEVKLAQLEPDGEISIIKNE